jgi:very-short-patch-repair endonuclease/predicted transcriptional regulator of viral defense system
MEPLLVAVAAAQCGVFSRVQALAAGYTDRRIRYLLATGSWLRCAQGIFRISGTPLTFDASAWIATLAAGVGAVLSHRIAGKLHSVEDTPPVVRFDVSVPPTRRPRNVPRANIHRIRLCADDVTSCQGFPVTSIPRTLIDLARTLPIDTGSRIIGDALRAGRVSVDALEARIAWLSGCTGIDLARRALTNADPILESVLERELLALLRRAGLNPIAQYVVTSAGQFVGRVDFALAGIRLAIEADGYDTHSRRPGFEGDREKAALLQLAGWSLLSFTATQIRQQPDWVIATVLERVRQLSGN